MTIRLLAALAGLALLLPAGRAQPPVIAAVQADQARVAAMAAGDAAALGRLLSDQLRFVHSDGRVESKADYLHNLLAGDTAYADVRATEIETMQVSHDVVVVLGRQQMRKRLGGQWSEVTLRYLGVWRHEQEGWRLMAWQSARPAGNSSVPSAAK